MLCALAFVGVHVGDTATLAALDTLFSCFVVCVEDVVFVVHG